MENTWNCQTCGRKFKTLLGLDNHTRSCSTSRPTVVPVQKMSCTAYHFDGHWATCR